MGVRKSAGMVAHNGMTLGAFGRFCETDTISCRVSSEGWILTWVPLETGVLSNQFTGHHTGGVIAIGFWTTTFEPVGNDIEN